MSLASSQSSRINNRQYWILALIAGLPLWSGLVLYLLNPDYTSRLVTSNPTQPLGWIVTGVIIVLAGLAYGCLLGSFWLIPSEQHKKRWLIAGLIFFLLDIPALILVILTPAALLVMQSFQL